MSKLAYTQQEPEVEHIISFDNGVRILPFAVIEHYLDQLCDYNWSTKNFIHSYMVINNLPSISASIELELCYAVSEPQYPIRRTLIGSVTYPLEFFKTIDKFLSSEGECELMIGFNADEEHRTGNLEVMKNVTYTYPLVEDGLSRDDCEQLLKKYGLHPQFPVYMARGGCRMCFFKSIKEFKALYHLNPDEFWEMVRFEESMQGTRTKYYAIRDGKPLRQLAEECKNEKLMFDDIESLYKSLKQETSCGAFCHR